MNKNYKKIHLKNDQAVSVVIGALMLTLIVVTAAISFSVFTAQKQKELQEAEYADLLREQEELAIASISTIDYKPTAERELENISFSIANLNIRESIIRNVWINDYVLIDFIIERNDNRDNEHWVLTKGSYTLLNQSFIFNDTNADKTYSSSDEIFEWGNDIDSDDVAIANPEEEYVQSGFYANSSGELFVFIDSNDNMIYDADEPILDYDPDNNKTDATPVPGLKAGIMALNNTDNQPFIFEYDGDYQFENTSDDIIYNDPNRDNIKVTEPENNVYGGLFSAYDMKERDGYNKLRLKRQESAKLIINEFINNAIYTDNKTFTEEEAKIKINDAIIISLYTELTNEFVSTFIPPTANINIIENDDSITLDASDSFAEDSAHIIEYEWNLTNSDANIYLPIMYGKTVNANRILIDHETVKDFNHSIVNWSINLTILDDNGMIGVSNYQHVQDFKPLMAELEVESLEIEDFQPTYNESTQKITNITLSIKNDYEFNSNITSMEINNKKTTNIPSWWSISSYSTSSEETINCSPEIDMQTPVTVKFKTALGNTFEKTFYPPNANAMIYVENIKINQSTYQDVPYLDASQSDHPGNGYIISWVWHLSTEPYLFNKTDGSHIDSTNDWFFNSSNNNVVSAFDPDRNGEDAKKYEGDIGGLYSIDSNNEPFIWSEVPIKPAESTSVTMDWEYNNDDYILSYDPDGNGIKAQPTYATKGGLYAIDTYNEPYIFTDNTSDWSYSVVGDYNVSLDPDGNGINATPSINDECGLYACDAITLYGRKIRAQFTYPDAREYNVMLTVIDNYRMKSIDELNYYPYS